MPATALAVSVPLVDNQVVMENTPSFSIGGENELGSWNYALNSPSSIDIPYAIFDFGSTSAISSTALNWNFGSLHGGTGPESITLFLGNDADEVFSVGDRFLGVAVDTFTYSGSGVRNFDVTSSVNTSLASGQYFVPRFEADLAPGALSGSGNFLTPSLDISPVSELETYAIFLTGLGLLAFSASRRKKHLSLRPYKTLGHLFQEKIVSN